MTHNVETARPGDEGHRESRTSSSCHVEATDVEDVGRGATETAERGTAVSNVSPSLDDEQGAWQSRCPRSHLTSHEVQQ